MVLHMFILNVYTKYLCELQMTIRHFVPFVANLFIDQDTIQKNIIDHVEYTLARTKHNFDSFAAYQATAYSYVLLICEHHQRHATPILFIDYVLLQLHLVFKHPLNSIIISIIMRRQTTRHQITTLYHLLSNYFVA